MPRLRIRKKTRAVLAGIVIALLSLYALSSAYDITRDEMLAFFLTSLALILIIMALAAALVAAYRLVRWFLSR